MILIADSGSTKCSWAICDNNGQVVDRCSTIGFNPYFITSKGVLNHLEKSSLKEIKDEIKEFLPYKVVETYGAEADDVIAIVCKHYQSEKIMIVSGDKDFIQLHKYENVRQYSPITKKHINGVNPVVYIKEHILKGDKSDGVPNVLSPDHTFTDDLRQRPLTSKKMQSILAQDIDDLNDEVKRNYQRNDKLINLDNIPEELEGDILDDFKSATCGDRSKLLNYFIDKRLKSLTEQIGEF